VPNAPTIAPPSECKGVQALASGLADVRLAGWRGRWAELVSGWKSNEGRPSSKHAHPASGYGRYGSSALRRACVRVLGVLAMNEREDTCQKSIAFFRFGRGRLRVSDMCLLIDGTCFHPQK
jgi:hypothetical protein